MPLLALDDTDTRAGGCTTWTALRIAAALERAGGPLAAWGLVDAPRLVRLCPSVPWKTRGNGALVLPIGHRVGTSLKVGHDGAQDLAAGVMDDAASSLDDHIVAALRALVGDLVPSAGGAHADPQPAALLLPRAPPRALYERAVASCITAEDAWSFAPPGTVRLTAAGRRGEIGALAASAWPMERFTWEYIAYRDREEVVAERDLTQRTRDTLLSVPGGFDNHDPATGRDRFVPRTPCPVLYGLRGTDPHALLRAAAAVDDARVAGWLVRTNHATGDHARFATAEARPWSVVRAQVAVTAPPRRQRGGHVFVAARCPDGVVTLAAFEPTKALREVVWAAGPGDILDVLARTGEDPSAWHLEAVRVERWAPRAVPMPNPRCPECARAMKSVGQAMGYRCRDCGTKAPPKPMRDIGPGAYHQVPDHVRGHLLSRREGLPGSLPLRDGPPGLPIDGVALAPPLLVSV